MAQRVVPTKGNLISTKKDLSLANIGYELLDKKRNVLIREMMMLIDKATEIQNTIEETYKEAYKNLQMANVTLGFVSAFAEAIPLEDSVKIKYRSVMGVEIPIITIDKKEQHRLYYGVANTNSKLDKAVISFHKVKYLTVELAEVETSVYRLAYEIKKTQKRANSLKNILIPKFENDLKFISEQLAEKEREEFSRLKVIKRITNNEKSQ